MAINDITGDLLVSKKTTEDYRNNYDEIFVKKDDLIEMFIKAASTKGFEELYASMWLQTPNKETDNFSPLMSLNTTDDISDLLSKIK